MVVLGAPFDGDIRPVTTQQLGQEGPEQSRNASGRAGCHNLVPQALPSPAWLLRAIPGVLQVAAAGVGVPGAALSQALP